MTHAVPPPSYPAGLLVCPVTREPLVPVPDETVEKMNRLAGSGLLRNRAGAAVRPGADAALARPDGSVVYPVYRGVPWLVGSEGVDGPV